MRTPLKLDARIVVALVAVGALASPARAAGDAQPAAAASPVPASPDEQARELFRSQRYEEALAIYLRLRAETRHPTYLRNIGRCHQMIGHPAPAIDAFETYLREAPTLDAAERMEIEGYIADMRRLELSAPPPASRGATAAPSSSGANAPTTIAASTASSPDGGSSIARRWWFWAGVAAVVVATGIIVVASSGQDRLSCPGGAVCP
jgi:tetratricopeptide (TPR) repeat protein